MTDTTSFLKTQISKIQVDNKKEEEIMERIEEKIKSIKKPSAPTSNYFLVKDNTIRKFWLIGAVAVYIAYVTYQTLDVIYMVFGAFILSMAAETLILFFCRRMSRGLAITLAYLIIFLFLISSIVFIIPFLVTQMASIVDTFVQQ